MNQAAWVGAPPADEKWGSEQTGPQQSAETAEDIGYTRHMIGSAGYPFEYQEVRYPAAGYTVGHLAEMMRDHPEVPNTPLDSRYYGLSRGPIAHLPAYYHVTEPYQWPGGAMPGTPEYDSAGIARELEGQSIPFLKPEDIPGMKIPFVSAGFLEQLDLIVDRIRFPQEPRIKPTTRAAARLAMEGVLALDPERLAAVADAHATQAGSAVLRANLVYKGLESHHQQPTAPAMPESNWPIYREGYGQLDFGVHENYIPGSPADGSWEELPGARGHEA